MNTLFGREPVMVMAVIQSAISLAVGFGLHWTADQIVLVNVFAATVLSLVARQKVTPT